MAKLGKNLILINTVIFQVYKQPLEKAAEDGDPILAVEDIKSVFNGVAEILSVHMKIHQELSNVISDWNEDCCIASIITKYQSQLTTVIISVQECLHFSTE